ncbi:MAG: COP23 domain-containing protein [Thainema sp.]
MKYGFWAISLASTFTVGFSSLLAKPAFSSDTIFLCETVNGTLTTVAHIREQPEPVEIVRWQSSRWFDQLYPPAKRCQEFASRLQTYYACGFITEFLENTGDIPSPFFVETRTFPWSQAQFPVIYVKVPPGRGDDRCASQRTADQELLLLMLEPGAETDTMVEQLETIRRGIGEPILSGSDR